VNRFFVIGTIFFLLVEMKLALSQAEESQ
jgi:hypothetical protein